MKLIGLVIVLIFLVNCKNFEKKRVILLPIKNKETLSKKTISIDSITFKKEIINNKFSNMPLGEFDFIDKNLSLFFKQSYDMYKSTKVNKYTDDIDTLITFKKGNSVVRFIKTSEKILLDSLDVSDKNFVAFELGVDIGMNKDEVLKLFKVNTNDSFSDTISILDDEGSASVHFLFVEKKLKKVSVFPW